MNPYKLIGPITQLITLRNTLLRGPLDEKSLDIITDGAILVNESTILYCGPYNNLIPKANKLNAEVVEIQGRSVGLPGMIDAHTHICFAGSRAGDYAKRNAGMSYLEISKEGGGIWDTVKQTRRATADELIQGIVSRSLRHIQNGVTTIEVKSGYGLSVSEELKILRAINKADQITSADLIPTCLAAHTHPRDHRREKMDYLEEIVQNLFPVMKSEKLSRRVDAFVEEEAFTVEEARWYFQLAKKQGLNITVHADQFTTGGSALAVEMNARSADHLEASTDTEIARLCHTDVVATVLPGATLGLGCPFAPARKILDRGGILAIASDWNPGSAPMGDLLTQTAILGAFEKLTNAELIAGITIRAAKALGLDDRGRLIPGKLADMVIFETDHYQEIFYHQGQMKPSQVWKKGKRVFPLT